MLHHNKLDESNIDKLADDIGETLSRLARQAHDIHAQEINYIINSKSIDIKDIERILDSLLECCYSSNILELFKKLCRYYYYINKQAVIEYVELYREMWDNDDE